jgi:uncharacterized protein
MIASRRFGWPVRAAVLLLAIACVTAWLRADNTLPPKPPLYFNDNAHVVDAATAADLNQQLEQFERDTSNQIVVAIYPSLPDGADASQYSTQTYNAWGVGQKNNNNGAVLFVFINDHKMFIATGRGLEGALPDITCEEIIRNEITPAFKQGDYAGGLRAGVAAMIAATKGEYKGNGQTVADQNQQHEQNNIGLYIFAFIVLLLILRGFFPAFLGGPYIYTGGGYGSGFGGGWGGGGFGGGGGGFGGGGGGGGFSGGGGGSAGGGAGGSW